jgi:hypothetical protein
MKKIILLFITMSGAAILYAQEPADALRYSWYTSNGTARQQAIGGAMTSLGGDLSALFVNPAGLGFYKTGDIIITPAWKMNTNKATYYKHDESDKINKFALGTSGFVLGEGYSGRNKSKGGGASFAIAVNQTANFGSSLLYRGVNNQSSYSQKFLEEIRNKNDKDANSVASAYPYGTSLAFNTYWIDTIAGGSSNNYQFKTRAPIANGLVQENNIESKGGITEVAIGGAVNLSDKFFAGGTIGFPILYYKRNSTFTEADASTDATNFFDYASISENLTTSGAGVNLKAGIIYKPKEFIRLGLAIHTPSFYTLTDKYNAEVTTNSESYHQTLTQSSHDFTNGNDAEFRYTYISPYRIMASASYVLREIQDVRKQKGFLTADLEYVNYKASSFKTDPDGDRSQSTKDYLKSLNKAIDNAYKSALNFKAGGELKFTTVMARLGFAYYGNPYKNLGHQEKGSKIQLSGGLGYRNKGFFVDATYVHTMGKDVHFAYRLENTAYSGATIKNTVGTALLTVGFKI